MGYKFSLVLSREITSDESSILQNSGCAEAVFLGDSLPTNADVAVTRMDFDDTVSPSLAEAIEAALDAVKKVPDLTVPGLTVPAQPATAEAQPADAQVADANVADGQVADVQAAEDAAEEEPKRKTPAKKTVARKASAKKAGAASA